MPREDLDGLRIVLARRAESGGVEALEVVEPGAFREAGQDDNPWSAPSLPTRTGATRLPYRRIAPYSVTAACLWATAEAGVGYAAASSLQRILTLSGPALGLVILIAIGITLLRRPSPHPTRRAGAIPCGGSDCHDGASTR